MDLFRRKSVTELQNEALTDHSLKRALGALNLTMLGIGAIIGTGIFVLTGTVAALNSGPAVVLSFALAGIASIFAALCYSEFASLVPMAGSAYTYGYATLGELIAWIIGWDLVLEYALGAVTVAIGWSGYVVSFLHDIGFDVPCALSAARGTMVTCHDGTQVAAIFNLPAVIIIGLVTTLLVIGIKESANFNNIIVFVKVAVVLLFIIFAAHAINPDNWHPFIPPQAVKDGVPAPGEFGWSGVFTGAAIVFFAYIGFDAVSTAAQEAKNPQKDMPIGIIGSLLICTVLYIIVSGIATGVMSYKELNVPDPIAVVADRAGLGWMSTLIKLGAIAGLSSVILVMLLGQSRVFYSMSRDGLLPPFVNKVHPKFQTPYLTSIVTGVAVAFFAAILPIRDAASLVSIGTLLAFVIVSVGILVLRVREPNLPRVFKTPWVWFVAPAGALSAAYLMKSLPPVTWERLLIWFVIGMVIYFSYGIRKSKLARRV
jgi:basic amino acid/polyamine antiporter, APA family